MKKHWEKAEGTAYGRFLSIVQSSGTGKSRMIDELSKEHLVVPINLWPRHETGELTPLSNLESIIITHFTGFPGADHNVRELLNEGTEPNPVYTLYAAFFTALFQELKVQLGKLKKKEKNTKNLTARFYSLMTQNQNYSEPNQYRKMFYDKVCQESRRVSNGNHTVIWCS